MACGPEPEGVSHSQNEIESAESCLNCNEVGDESDEDDYSQSSHVNVFPQELMFYGELSASDILAETVTVKNATLSSVMITAVYVVGDTTIYGDDADEFFQTDWEYSSDNLLGPGDSLDITVQFHPSHELRSGGLFIETTHISFGLLEVELSGKLFAEE